MKKMTIRTDVALDDVKKDFNQLFPFLRLEFFKHDHNAKEPSSKKEMILGNPTLNLINKQLQQGYIDVKPSMSVADLEMKFKDDFNLNVQVFRKSGRVWLETSSTDNLSLSEQNELGKEKSTPLEKVDPTDIDYD